MSQMKELYEKVAKDAALQEKLLIIIKDAEEAGEEDARGKLVDFTKDAGYDVTLEEIQSFFKDLSKETEGELSDAELDMAAGGKANSYDQIIREGHKLLDSYVRIPNRLADEFMNL